jgi:hypothetical protein
MWDELDLSNVEVENGAMIEHIADAGLSTYLALGLGEPHCPQQRLYG